MLHPVKNDDGPSFRVLLFYFFLLSTFSGVQTSELICSHQPIAALAGDDVILPCRLEPAVSVSTVEWSRPDLDPKYIHVQKDGRSMLQNQNPSYRYRTKLFTSELKKGNVSLRIIRVKMSDKGKYQCVLPSNKEAFIELNVGAVSTPTIELLSNDSLSLVLSCKSKGWYPEPEVLWLDGGGNLLSAEPTETIRGPDDLYTVSSRVTVEKRHSNRFTCRVQQKNINQTREAHFDVSDDPDKPPDTLRSVSTILYAVLFPVVLLVLLVVAVFIIKKLRRTNDPLKRLRIFLFVSIVLPLLLLLLLLLFLTVSVMERIEYTYVYFNTLEVSVIVCLILLPILLVHLLVVAVFIVNKLRHASNPDKCLRIFLTVSIIILLLLLLLHLLAVAISVIVRLRYNNYTFTDEEIFVSGIIIIYLFPLFLVVALFVVKKLRCQYDPVKRLDIFLIICIILLLLPLLLLLAVAVFLVKKLIHSNHPFEPLEIFLIVSIIVFLLPLFLVFAVFIVNERRRTNIYFNRLRIFLTVSIIVLLLLLSFLLFFVTHSVNVKLKYNNVPLNPLEISMIVSVILLFILVLVLLVVALFIMKKLNDTRTETNKADRSSPQDDQAASNDTPPEQIALVGPSTTDSSTKKPTETPSGGN